MSTQPLRKYSIEAVCITAVACVGLVATAPLHLLAEEPRDAAERASFGAGR